MTPDMRRKYDTQEQERMERKEKVFEHIKYNMNSNRPSMLLRRDNVDRSMGCTVGQNERGKGGISSDQK